jgi:hypothetical protein
MMKEIFFDPFPLHLVTRTSPMNPSTGDDEWLRLVEAWKKPEKWYKKPTLALYFLLWHLSNFCSLYDVGDLSKEQRQPGFGQVPWYNWLM